MERHENGEVPRACDAARIQEKVLSLSALLAPSVCFTDANKTKLKRLPPSTAYIAALRAEGLRVPAEKPPRVQGPIDAEDYIPSLQIFYVKCAAKDGDWRALRGTRPTPKMQDLFVIARARYIAWKKRLDEEEEREEQLPKSWFEIESGRFVFASSEEKARAFAESVKLLTSRTIKDERHARERVQIDIDTSKTCPRCKMRRVDPDRPVCGNCFSMEGGR